MSNDVENFLKEINQGEAFVDATPTETEALSVKADEKVEEIVPFHKDERFTRTRQELKTERETRQKLEQEIEQLKKARPSEDSYFDERKQEWIKTFGDDETSKAQADYFSNRDRLLIEKAKAEAIAEFEQRTTSEKKEVDQWNTYVQSQLEELEEERGIDLTSSQAESKRTEFMEFLQDISPKDSNGNIVQYVDMGKAFDLFQKAITPRKDNTERKEIASRSMDKTNTETPKTYQQVDLRNSDWRDWARHNGEL